MSEGKRIARLEALKREIADLLKAPLDDQKVEQVAFLRLLREGEMEKFISGSRIDVRAYLDLDKVLAEVTPPRHRSVTIELASGVVDVCPRCNWTRPAAVKPETEPSPPPPAPQTATSDNDTLAAAAPAKVVPLRTKTDDHAFAQLT